MGSKRTYTVKEILKLRRREADLETSLAIGGGALLSTPQHALDGPEHTEATGTADKLATTGHSGLLLPLSGDADDRLAGDGSWAADSSGSGVTLDDYEGQHRYLLAAHRGDMNPVDGYPENTKESMRLGALRGADQVECDVQMSSDGIWHLMHDEGASALNRTTNLSGNITATSAAAIAAGHIDGGYGYDAGRHGTSLLVPTLASVFDAIRPYGCVILLDCKIDGTAGALAQFVVDNFLPERVIVNAHSLTDAAAVKAVDARIIVSAQTAVTSAPQSQANVDVWIAENTEITALSDSTSRAPDEVIAFFQVATYYGVDETSLISTMYDRGVRGVITNDLPRALLIRHAYQFATGGFATPAIVLGSAAADGAAATAIRSDATIVAFDATAPVTQNFSDVAATGSAAKAARRDHRHGMPANPGGHTHVATEVHLSDGATTTYILDNYYEPESVVAWNVTTLARLIVTEVLPDRATVSAAGSSGDNIVFDYAASLA